MTKPSNGAISVKPPCSMERASWGGVVRASLARQIMASASTRPENTTRPTGALFSQPRASAGTRKTTIRTSAAR